MSCGNTHDPTSAQAANNSAQPPSQPQLPPKEAPVVRQPQKAPQKDKPISKQPAHLKHGRERHDTLQREHRKALEKQGVPVSTEFRLDKPTGKQGRADFVGYLSNDQKDAVIQEFKTDRLDRLTPKQLETRVEKHIQQVVSYRESETLDLKSSQSVLHFDEWPAMEGYAEYVEERCLEEGIMVFFLNE